MSLYDKYCILIYLLISPCTHTSPHISLHTYISSYLLAHTSPHISMHIHLLISPCTYISSYLLAHTTPGSTIKAWQKWKENTFWIIILFLDYYHVSRPLKQLLFKKKKMLIKKCWGGGGLLKKYISACWKYLNYQNKTSPTPTWRWGRWIFYWQWNISHVYLKVVKLILHYTGRIFL